MLYFSGGDPTREQHTDTCDEGKNDEEKEDEDEEKVAEEEEESKELSRPMFSYNRCAMLQAPRSTISGNALETMRPPGIKRSTLFRRRDTCSRARRVDSRITANGCNQRKRMSSVGDVATACQLQVVNRANSRSGVKAENITGGYRPRAAPTRFEERICRNEAKAAEAKVLENSESKIHLESGRALEEFESCWEWKVEERPRRSPGMSKLRSLQLERADLFSGLRSGLQKMLEAVREMKSQQSKSH